MNKLTIKLIVFFSLLALLSSCSYLPEKYRPKGEKAKLNLFLLSWTKNLDPAHETGNLPIAVSWPFIHEGIVFQGDNSGVMRAYDLDNGKVLWEEKDNGSYHASSTFFEDNIIYGTSQGRLYARNYLTGKLAYSLDLDASIESKPIIYKGRAFIQLRNHKVYCLDASSGKTIWAYKRSVPYMTTLQRVSRPLIRNGKIFVGFADGAVAALSVEEGLLQWENKIVRGEKFVDVDSNPLWFQDKLIFTALSGEVSILDPSSGSIIRKLPFSSSRSPFIKGNKLIVLTTDGELIEFDSSFNLIKKTKISNESLTSIQEWKSKFVVSSIDGNIYLLEKDNLKVLESYELGHKFSSVFGEIAISENKMAIFSSRNRLYIFR